MYILHKGGVITKKTRIGLSLPSSRDPEKKKTIRGGRIARSFPVG